MKVQVFHMIRIDENYTHYRASVFGSTEASSTLWNKDGYRLAGEFDFGHLAPVGRDLDRVQALSMAWERTQNITKPWKDGERSSMVGDIFVIGDNGYVITGVGFKDLDTMEVVQ